MIALCLMFSCVATNAQLNSSLPVYSSKYYDIYSDVDEIIVREASLRMTRMAEEYHARTKAFAGAITSKFPLYIYRHESDYLAAGGLQGSSGVYTGHKLMAFVGGRPLSQLWRALQHEGFHQFVDIVIGGDMPVWLDEGLAEYFAESMFTGDGFVAGLVPGLRKKRIKKHIVKHEFSDMVKFMRITRNEWNEQLSRVNYDQAWSLVHFLAHADNGKYRTRFDHFMRDISRMGADQAWDTNFGSNKKALASRWGQYWLNLPKQHGTGLYVEATVATLTSFLARGVAQGMSFLDAQAFITAAGKIRLEDKNWLPPTMLERALQHARALKPWTLSVNGQNSGSLSIPHERQIIHGFFELSGKKVKSVTTKRTRR